jgi:alanyl-tRNA synthetase
MIPLILANWKFVLGMGLVLALGAYAGILRIETHAQASQIASLKAQHADDSVTIDRLNSANSQLVAQVQTQNISIETYERAVADAQSASQMAMVAAAKQAATTAGRIKMLESARATPGRECQDASALIEAAILGAAK